MSPARSSTAKAAWSQREGCTAGSSRTSFPFTHRRVAPLAPRCSSAVRARGERSTVAAYTAESCAGHTAEDRSTYPSGNSCGGSVRQETSWSFPGYFAAGS